MVDNIAIMQLGDTPIDEIVQKIHADKIDIYTYPKEISMNEFFWEYKDLMQHYHDVILAPCLKYKELCGFLSKESEKRA